MGKTSDGKFDVIASRHLVAQILETKERVAVVAKIGKPYWVSQDIEAACPIAIEGRQGRLPDIRGIDPIDALKNAIGAVENLLNNSSRAHELFWPDGESYDL